jgi:ABC-type transport system substrate-binding protein
MLRHKIDMLYEVGADALSSLTGATDVSVFTFVRHYQLLLVLNPNAPALQDAKVRRALNLAVDRRRLIDEGLSGHGVISSGPIWPSYWAFQQPSSKLEFDSRAANEILRPRHISFACLVPPDFERAALVLKQQLEAVGVEIRLIETPFENVTQALVTGKFDAVLADIVSAPTLFRVYRMWHSKGLFQGSLGNPRLDAALDRIRFATNDSEYENAVRGLQESVAQDPPAVFLAWSERARAVSRRFDVHAEPGRDILSTLRMWRPSTDAQYVGRN